MSVSNSDIAAIPAYTDAELLILFRAALVNISAGNQAVRVQGREYTRADLAEVRKTIDWLEDRVQATSSTESDNAGIVLVRTGKPA